MSHFVLSHFCKQSTRESVTNLNQFETNLCDTVKKIANKIRCLSGDAAHLSEQRRQIPSRVYRARYIQK